MFTRTIFLVFILGLIFTGGSLNYFSKQVKIEWTTKKLESSVFAGGSRTVTVEFNSSKDIVAAEVLITPGLESFIKIISARPLNISKGKNVLDLSIKAPNDRRGTIGGTLHIKNDGQIIAVPLIINIKILENSVVEDAILDFLMQELSTTTPVIPTGSKSIRLIIPPDVEKLLSTRTNLPSVFRLSSVVFDYNIPSDPRLAVSIPMLLSTTTENGIRIVDVVNSLFSHVWHRDDDVRPLIPSLYEAITFLPGMTIYDTDGNNIADTLFISIGSDTTHIILKPGDADEIITAAEEKNFITPLGIKESSATAIHELVHVFDFRTECGGGEGWYASQLEEDFVSYYVEPLIKGIFSNTNTLLLNSTVNAALDLFPNTQNCLERLDLTRPTPVVSSASSDNLVISLSWSKNNDRDFESYRIYRRTSSGVGTDDELISTINDIDQTSFVDNSLDGENFYYKVFVFDKAGLSSESNEVSARISPPPGPQPGPNIGDTVSIPMLSGGIYGIGIEDDDVNLSGITFISENEVLLAEGSGELSKVNLNTGKVATVAFVSVMGIVSPVLEPSGRSVLVLSRSEQGGTSTGIKRINLETGEVSTVIEGGIDRGVAMAMEQNGSSVLVTGSSGGFYRVNLDTKTITVISDIGGMGLAIEPSGQTALVATGIFGAGTYASCYLARVDLSTGTSTVAAYISCSDRPAGVAIEPSGQTALVTTNQRFVDYSGRIFRVNLNTGSVTYLTSCPICSFPQIKMEPGGQSALFIGESSESLIRLDLNNLSKTVLARSVKPKGLALSGDKSTVYVNSYFPFISGKISGVDLEDGTVQKISSIYSPLDGIILSKDKTNLFVPTRSYTSALMEKINVSTGEKEAITLAPSYSIKSFAFEDNETSALVIAEYASLNKLYRADFSEGTLTPIFAQLTQPRAVIIEEEASALVIENKDNGTLSRLNLETGQVEFITSGIGQVASGGGDSASFVLEPDRNNVLIALPIGGVLRVNLNTGAKQTIASSVCGLGSGLFGIIIEEGGETALLSHPQCGILRMRVK